MLGASRGLLRAASRATAHRAGARCLSAAAPAHDDSDGAAMGSAENPYDVLIVGGGIVGAALACRLAASPYFCGGSVSLIETAPPPSLAAAMAKPLPDLRVYAMTPSSIELLRDTGVWSMLDGAAVPPEARRACPYFDMQVWDAGGSGHVRFNGEAAGSSDPRHALGRIVEHGALQSALFERMATHAAAGALDLHCPAKLLKVRAPASANTLNSAGGDYGGAGGGGGAGAGGSPWAVVSVEIGGGGGPEGGAAPERRDLHARLVVAADGANSAVREQCGLGSWGWGYDQKAVVATVETDEVHGTAWQRFLPTGPVALLPVREHEALSSIVWSTTPAHAARLCGLPAEEFVAELNHALSGEVVDKSAYAAGGGAPGAMALELGFAAAKSMAGVGLKVGQGAVGALAQAVGGAAQAAAAAVAMAPPSGGGGGGGGSGGGGLPGGPSAASGAMALQALSGALSAAAAQVEDLAGGEEEGAAGEFQFPPIVLDSPGARVSFPLRLNHATSYVAPRVALVGDAAHTVHPLAGQGLNLGMADIGALAAVLGDGAAAGRDVGEELLLRTYEEERKGANLTMSAVCDVTKRLFSTPPPAPGSAAAELLHASPEALARNLGMEVLNETPPLKRLVAKVAMGGKLMPF